MAYRNHRNEASRPSIYQTVTDSILSSLKAGVIPWEKPWKTPRYAGGPFPRNFYTGKPYRGINVLLLWSSEYSSPFWLTFKQAQALKGNVRKGESTISRMNRGLVVKPCSVLDSNDRFRTSTRTAFIDNCIISVIAAWRIAYKKFRF